MKGFIVLMPDRFDVAGTYLARILAGSDTASARKELDDWQHNAPENQDAADRVFAAWETVGAAGDAPEIQRMLAEMRTRHDVAEAPQKQGRTRWQGWAVAAGLAAVLSIPTAYWLLDTPQNQPMVMNNASTIAIHATRLIEAPNGRRTVLLNDGSHVTLDVGSSVRIAFSADRRGVTLEKGRAHFEVNKDKHRPFVVTAGRLTATAVGTAFDVRLSGQSEEVMTSEGVVRVVTQFPAADHGRQTLLNAGMKLTQLTASVVVISADPIQETAWTNGKIIASSRCLGEVASQMNRYGKSTLIVAKDAENIAISGVFDLDNGAGLAEALEQQSLTTVRRDGSRIMLSRTGSAPAACRPAT